MVKEITAFGNTETEKQKFHHYKNPVFFNNCSGKNNYKYFIGYLDDDFKTNAYIKSHDGESKSVYLSIDDDELLKRCDDI